MKQVGIPFSLEAENYLLATMMIDNSVAHEFSARLHEDHFYNEENKKIFTAISNICRRHEVVEEVAVAEELKKLHLLESIGGHKYLNELLLSIPETSSVEEYAKILEKKEIERALYKAAQNISKEILNGESDFQDILSRAEKSITNVINKQKTAPLVRIDTATEKTMEIIETNKNNVDGGLLGIDTGFEEINSLTYGFQKGQLIILAARPGIGKSTLALNIAANACEFSKAHVAFFSLEMGTEQLIMKLLSTYSGVNSKKILKGDLDEKDMTKIAVARQKINEFNFYFDESTNNSLEDIKAKCRKYKREDKLDFIVIDYLQLLSTGNRNNNSRYEEVSQISRGLKLLARELEVPVLALAQLSRDIEKRRGTDKEADPMLSDLKESGSIEQDADIVIFIDRRNDNGPKTKLLIEKNRQGERGKGFLQFIGGSSKFVSYTEESK